MFDNSVIVTFIFQPLGVQGLLYWQGKKTNKHRKLVRNFVTTKTFINATDKHRNSAC